MTTWKDFQLYLFDFDGILVDTEMLHFQAYKEMLARRGFDLKWSHRDYAKLALFKSGAIATELYALFPKLQELEPRWEVLYAEKRARYLELLENEGTQLMPGVEELLTQLNLANITSCVVTHSPLEQIKKIRGQHSVLELITHWITREDYDQPKPHPECYQTAIKRYAKLEDHIIGFEDSPRGMMALSGSTATPFLITSFLEKNEIDTLAQRVQRPFTHLPSFKDFIGAVE